MQRDYTNLLKLLGSIWLGLGLVVLVIYATIQIFDILILFVVAGMIATAFAPSVRWLQKRLSPKVPRAVIVIFTYIFGLSVAGLVIGALSLPLVSQSTQLAEQAPELIAKAPQALPYVQDLAARVGIDIEVNDLVRRFTQQLQGASQTVFSGLASGLIAVTSAVAQTVIAIIISIYMLLSAGQFRKRLLGAVPQDHRDDVDGLVGRLTEIASGFIRGQLILAMSIGIPVGIFLWIIGVPYSALLGLISGLAEFIPVVGSFLGAIPAILVALIFLGPQWALIVAGFFVLVNQASSNILQPRIIGGQLGLHPLTSIFALAVGYQFFGFWGAIFGAPAAAVIWALWRAAREAWPRIMGQIAEVPATDDVAPRSEPTVKSPSAKSPRGKKGQA